VQAGDAIKTTVKNGRIEMAVPPGWPDGCEVVIERLLPVLEKIGLDESEWQDDSASLADWDAWLKTIEPLELTPAEQAAFAKFDKEMLRFNIEAVRQQMKKELLP
jgi:hypothetical protein